MDEQRDQALAACRTHAAGVARIREAYREHRRTLRAIDAKHRRLAWSRWGPLLFAVGGHALLQAEVQGPLTGAWSWGRARLMAGGYTDHIWLMRYPYDQIVLGFALIGIFWLTCAQAASHDSTLPFNPRATGWAESRNFPVVIYLTVLGILAYFGWRASASWAVWGLLTALGGSIGLTAWIRLATMLRGMAAAREERSRLDGSFGLIGKLAEVANEARSHYGLPPDQIARLRVRYRKGMPLMFSVHAIELILAVGVAYPGHFAMGEILGYTANWSLGFKVYPQTWPIVAALLLVAEALLILGAIEARLAEDARIYLHKGYDPVHLDRGYSYRGHGEIAGHRHRSLLFRCTGLMLAAADFAFNLRYTLDNTGMLWLAVLLAGFFTGLLVGLSTLLGHTVEYHHQQIRDTLRSWESREVPEIAKA